MGWGLLFQILWMGEVILHHFTRHSLLNFEIFNLINICARSAEHFIWVGPNDGRGEITRGEYAEHGGGEGVDTWRPLTSGDPSLLLERDDRPGCQVNMIFFKKEMFLEFIFTLHYVINFSVLIMGEVVKSSTHQFMYETD